MLVLGGLFVPDRTVLIRLSSRPLWTVTRRANGSFEHIATKQALMATDGNFLGLSNTCPQTDLAH